MANRSNETSRQKRARENRARRAALEARTKAAKTPRDERVAKAAPSAKFGEGSTKAGSGGARQAMAQGRLGQVPVEIDELEGSFLGRFVHVPGGMQVIMAAVLVFVLTAMLVFTNTVPPEGSETGADPTRTILDAYGPSAILFLAPPVILVGNAIFFGLHERRRRMWIISAVMLAIFSIASLMLQYVFPAGFLGYAAYRSKRIEEGSRTAPRAAPKEAPDAVVEASGEEGEDPSEADRSSSRQ